MLTFVNGCTRRESGKRESEKPIIEIDYLFALEGTVVTSDGQPIEHAQVTLRTDYPLYEAITPICEVSVTTDRRGRFKFTYLTNQHSHPYTLTVSHANYQAVEIKGTGPGRGDLGKITLEALESPE
jgi:hypothetical protein